MAAPPDAILAFSSAAPLLLLGVALLFIRPHRTPQVFFGLFAVMWAAQIAFANAGRVGLASERLYPPMLLMGQALMPIAALFLAHFAVALSRRRWRFSPTLAFAGIAILSLLALIFSPERVVEAAQWRGGQAQANFGDLVFPLFQGPLRLAFYFALAAIYMEYRHAKPGTPRRRLRGVLLALAIYVSYDTSRLFLSYLLSPDGFSQFSSSAVQSAGGIADLGATAFLLLGTLFVAALAGVVYLRPPPPEEPDSPLLFAFVFPIVVAATEVVLGRFGIAMETLGFWRFLMVGVVVFTLANYQLFDLELRLKRFAAPVVAGLLVLFGIPLLLALAMGEFGTSAILFALVPQVVGVAGVVVFQERVRNSIFPGVQSTPDYLHQRRLEIYRVALEDLIARGGSPDDESLRELRLRSGVTDQEHTILAWVATSGRPAGAGEETSSFEPGAIALDRYRVERLIGQGTYGRTILAYDMRARRQVAIKTVHVKRHAGDAARLLLREARLAASIHHPNVIQILDVAELEDRVAVVMEYADNGNLEAYMKREGHISLPDAVRFLRELLSALEAVHARGIVHRNLKPKNILIEADDSVRLSDFGAATAETDRAEEVDATRTLVDLLYQSPEQLGGEPATPQSDLFVAAVLFHQAATGRYPFPISGKSDYQIRETIRMRPPELHLTGMPGWLEPFLREALAQDPTKRFRDAASMRRALEEAAGL